MGCSVTRRGRSVYEGRPPAGGGRSMPGAGRGASVSVWATRAAVESCGRQGLLAELSQGVVTALEEFARDGQTGSVAPEALCGLLVVGVVGRAGPAGALRGLEERPAQRRRSLTGEMAWRAAGVGLMEQ